jgi:hypothetical protein
MPCWLQTIPPGSGVHAYLIATWSTLVKKMVVGYALMPCWLQTFPPGGGVAGSGSGVAGSGCVVAGSG